MAHNASVLTRDELKQRRGKHWNHGYRLGLRMAEDEEMPRPPKQAMPASRSPHPASLTKNVLQ